jgi:hypothetical protein
MAEIEVDTIVEVTKRGADCHRADGTGSSWELVVGTYWRVVGIEPSIAEGGYTYKLDDRDRFKDGQPAFEAYVSSFHIEPALPLVQLAMQARGDA